MKRTYPGRVNSPYTTTTADIGDSDTTIPVTELWVFPPGENLAVIGDGNTAETIRYTEKSASSGYGNLTGVTRHIQGSEKGWLEGTKISRRFTAYDYDALRENLLDITVLEGQTAGEDLTVSDLVTLGGDGKWYLTDARDPDLGFRGQIGVVLDAMDEDETGRIQLAGKVTDETWEFDPGDVLYLGNTPGTVTSTPGSYPRRVGYAVASDTFIFSPKNEEDLIKLAIYIFNDSVSHMLANTDISFSAALETRYSIVSYDWDFDDGSAHSTELAPVHKFPSPGQYEVVLTVTDTLGNKGVSRCVVRINPIPATNIQGIVVRDIPTGAISHTLTLTSPNYASDTPLYEELKNIISHNLTIVNS